MSPIDHAQMIVDNYTSTGLGDPRQSDDHAVAVAVALLDREKSCCSLPELTDDERKAMDAIDMTPLLGSPSERLKLAMETAVKFMRKSREAETAAKHLLIRMEGDGWDVSPFIREWPWLR